MRWEGREESDNVEDQRGRSPLGRGAGIGLGGLLVVIVIALITGRDPTQILQLLQGTQEGAPQQTGPTSQQAPPANDTLGRFARVVLRDTEVTWETVFTKAGRHYTPPKMVLFSDAVDSACGYTSSAVGPFYCPADRKVYLDLSFFDELSRKFGAPGDFAHAYVIAHEVGHHVQNLLGISDKVDAARARMGERESNALSVKVELQADCLAGVWAHYAAGKPDLLEPGDLEAGLRAAAAIGDDRHQRQGSGRVQPESRTPGSSAERVRLLREGIS
ncbi:MAG: neutral zinc metallopeptidase, partial [Vicinamibacteria bacterium]